jgi:trehalose/maltose hydrolase-like predicted phosphorylase
VIGRSFAAVVFDWDGTAVAGRRVSAAGVRRRVEALCAAGVQVAIVSGTDVGSVDGQLRARPAASGRLLLGVNRGSELYEVTASGPQLLHRRVAEPTEEAALDRAAALMADHLTGRGLPAQVVSSSVNRRKIDLMPEPEWSDPPEARIAELLVAVTARLRQHGYGDRTEVIRVAHRLAAQAGLADARVTSDAKHVEIGLTDESDSMRAIVDVLAGAGIGSGLLLLAGDEFGPIDGVAGSDSLLLIPGTERACIVSVGSEPAGVPDGVRHLGGGPTRFAGLLDEQLDRHRHRRIPAIDPDPSWVIQESGDDPLVHRVIETLFTVGAGGIATRGSISEPSANSTPLVLAAGVYQGTNSGQHLLPGPVWTGLDIGSPPTADVRVLDLRTGVLTLEEHTEAGTPLRTLRFASVTLPGVVALRAEAEVGRLHAGQALRAADAAIMTEGHSGGRVWARAGHDGNGGIGAVARQHTGRDGGVRTVERIAGYVSDPKRQPSLSGASDLLDAAEAKGFDRLLAEHRAAWARRWQVVDVRIPDDPAAELRIRYALFQLWCNTGRHDELAVGARGVSGTGYAGHVFWDADVFVLPALVSMDPLAARAMLRYRRQRLAPAKARARAEGRTGARFPWESAATGMDVTPRGGVLGGQHVPILTGQQEEHITADVAWAAVHYAQWTGTTMNAQWPELPLVLETARYWASRSRRDGDGSVHIETVIGPDEYHESVDDNAYTNVMARWNLRAAARLAESGGITGPELAAEAREWRAIAECLVDGYDPGTGRYEQFRGYNTLEPLLIDHIATPPVAADVLLGHDRIAASQVIKQPDVLMLHHLVPGELAPDSLRPNLNFYQPRTAHGSSLSPPVTASLLARAGQPDDALAMLRLALDIDLQDLSGTTAAGLHLATLGGVWQAVLIGFAGVRVSNGTLHLDPVLPTAWPTLQVRFRCLGRAIRLDIAAGAVEVLTDGPVWVQLDGAPARQVIGGAVLHRSNRSTSSGHSPTTHHDESGRADG